MQMLKFRFPKTYSDYAARLAVLGSEDNGLQALGFEINIHLNDPETTRQFEDQVRQREAALAIEAAGPVFRNFAAVVNWKMTLRKDGLCHSRQCGRRERISCASTRFIQSRSRQCRSERPVLRYRNRF